jgi:glycosyltransferase involved in cell wall biosynthesis
MGISVIIPAYNAERFLEATVRSVLSQQSADWDLTIVDDGSRDQTGAVADRFAAQDARVRAIHQENRGLAGARNAGFAASDPKSDLVLFLDADDVLEPDALGVLSALLDSSPSVDAAHGAARLIDPTGAPLDVPDVSSKRSVPSGGALVPADPSLPTTHEMLAVNNYIQSAGAVLIRKSAIAEVGLFDQTIAGTADYDMWFRLTRRGPILFTPRVVLAYRIHPTSMSRSRTAMRPAGLRMRRNWLATAADPAERALIHRGYRLSVRAIARAQRQALWRHISGGHVKQALRALPLVLFCQAKALPGASRLILATGADSKA